MGYGISRCGGIGRRIRLKIVRETIWVRVPSAAGADSALQLLAGELFSCLPSVNGLKRQDRHLPELTLPDQGFFTSLFISIQFSLIAPFFQSCRRF